MIEVSYNALAAVGVLVVIFGLVAVAYIRDLRASLQSWKDACGRANDARTDASDHYYEMKRERDAAVAESDKHYKWYTDLYDGLNKLLDENSDAAEKRKAGGA